MKKLFALVVAASVWVDCGAVVAQSAGGSTMNVLYLGGKNAYVQLPPNIFDRTAQATVEAWVKWEKFNKWSRVFDFGREGNAVVVQNEKTSTTLNYRIWDKGGKQHGTQAKNAVSAGSWYHIAVVCGYGGMEFYVNGSLVDSDKYTGGLDEASGGNNYIGRSNWPKDKLFQGYIAEFRVWDGRRSQSEISTTMNRLLTGKESGLIAYWRFNEANGSSVPDHSGSGHTATLAGNAKLVSVPAISDYLVPGRLEEDAEAHYGAAMQALGREEYETAVQEFRNALSYVFDYRDANEQVQRAQQLADETAALQFYTSGEAKMAEGAYREAYDDFGSALARVSGYRDASEKMQEAVEKGRYRVAVYPFKTSVYGANVDLLYQTMLMELMDHKSPFVEIVDQGTLNQLFADQGMSLSVIDPLQTLNAARSSNIRVVVLGSIMNAGCNTSGPHSQGETAFRIAEQEYYDDKGKKQKKKVPVARETYYIVSKTAQATCEVNLKIVDTATGQVLKSEMFSKQCDDAVEYADYSGDLAYLWVEDPGFFGLGKGWKSLAGQEGRFQARRDLKDSGTLLSEATRELGKEVSGQMMGFLDSYSPPPISVSVPSETEAAKAAAEAETGVKAKAKAKARADAKARAREQEKKITLYAAYGWPGEGGPSWAGTSPYPYDPEVVRDGIRPWGFAGHCSMMGLKIYDAAVNNPGKKKLVLNVIFLRKDKYGNDTSHKLGAFTVSDLDEVRKYTDFKYYVLKSGIAFKVAKFLNKSGYYREDDL